MDLIPLNLPWHPRQQIFDLPEAQFIYAIILTAIDDATKRFNCPIRNEARSWFYGQQFKELCDVLELDSTLIRKHIRQKWRI